MVCTSVSHKNLTGLNISLCDGHPPEVQRRADYWPSKLAVGANKRVSGGLHL